jgi:hypothetical protein
VYAVETTKTTRDEVSAQGFGYTSPLAVPQKETHFVWQGELFNGPGSLSGSSNARKELDQLASNFADNYRRSLCHLSVAQGTSPYDIHFGVPADIRQSYVGDEHERVRNLTDVEREAFVTAFREANRKAAKKK